MSGHEVDRVWEVDWAIPKAEGGSAWASYDWLLHTARRRGLREVTIVAATYDTFARTDLALGRVGAGLRAKPHRWAAHDITVHGASMRGSWFLRGPCLVAWANEDRLREIEARHPVAIAAVASWPDDIAGWRKAYGVVDRLGQVRPDQEAQFDTKVVTNVLPIVADAFATAGALINQAHSVLSGHERDRVARALVELRASGANVDQDALAAHLLAEGWNGELVDGVLKVAARVASGMTPRGSR